MIEKKLNVKLKEGLQARPAAKFVQEANRFDAEVYIEKNGKRANAKSIMGIMSLAIGAGTDIVMITDGPDEEEALAYLTSFILEP
ncbi:MAG: HPr family phosphocarrier protein [Bacillaceae bacterium]